MTHVTCKISVFSFCLRRHILFKLFDRLQKHAIFELVLICFRMYETRFQGKPLTDPHDFFNFIVIFPCEDTLILVLIK